jgi:hypothetical protein
MKRFSMDFNLPARGLQKPGKKVEQRGLSTPGGSYDRPSFALIRMPIEAFEETIIGVLEIEVLNSEHLDLGLHPIL